MRIVTETITFIITAIFMTFWACNVFLPIFYSVPKATYRVLVKRSLRPGVILVCLYGPILWIIIPLVFAMAITSFIPKLSNYLINESVTFYIAQPFALIMVVLNAFRKDGRKDMSADFEDFISPYKK